MRAARTLGKALAATSTLAVSLLACTAGRDAEPSGIRLVSELIDGENCETPCLWGTSLRGASFEETMEVLRTIPLMQDVILDIQEYSQTDPYTQTETRIQAVSWVWPEATSRRLASDGMQLIGDRNYNYMWFSDGILESVHIGFAIRLGELVEAWGPPRGMFTGPYRPLMAGLVLVYEHPIGHFGAFIDCHAPELSPNTIIRSYSYQESFQADLFSTYESVVPWNGYNADGLDCAFTPP